MKNSHITTFFLATTLLIPNGMVNVAAQEPTTEPTAEQTNTTETAQTAQQANTVDTTQQATVTYGTPTWTWANDYSYAYATQTSSNGSQKTTKFTATSQVIKPVLCIQDGTTRYTVKLSNGNGGYYVDQKTVTISKNTATHHFGNPV